jgi:hypothetical protein
MTFRRDLDLRLSRLEAETRDIRAELHELMRFDGPLMGGSEEHKAAKADPVKYNLAYRQVMWRPKLPSSDPGDVWPDAPVL